MSATGWNLVLYAIAGDDAELARATAAVHAMHGALTTKKCNIGVQLHARSRTTRYWLSAGHKLKPESLGVVDASDPDSLTRFLDAGNGQFPDRANALVLWAHSTGLDHVHNYARKAASRGAGPESGPGDHAGHGLGGMAVESIDELGRAGIPPLVYPLMPGPLMPGPLMPGPLMPGPRTLPPRYGCGWGPDPNTKHFLTNIGMKKAILRSRRGRVEILGLNACWMASLEVEYELRRVSDVQIACQVDALPWPYGTIVAAIAEAPEQTTEQLAIAIVDSVRTEIHTHHRTDALSALMSGPALDELATAFQAYARRVTELIDSDWKAVSKAVMEEAQRVDDPYLVDLMSLIHVLGHNDVKARTEANVVAHRFRSMCLANAASTGHPHVRGLSVFCPRDTKVDLAGAYKGTEFRSHSWGHFLLKFQHRLGRAAS
ncbi:MAG TPA: clostripain-related cysteine peptidase [Kofleriaceae bacterium]